MFGQRVKKSKQMHTNTTGHFIPAPSINQPVADTWDLKMQRHIIQIPTAPNSSCHFPIVWRVQWVPETLSITESNWKLLTVLPWRGVLGLREQQETEGWLQREGSKILFLDSENLRAEGSYWSFMAQNDLKQLVIQPVSNASWSCRFYFLLLIRHIKMNL